MKHYKIYSISCLVLLLLSLVGCQNKTEQDMPNYIRVKISLPNSNLRAYLESKEGTLDYFARWKSDNSQKQDVFVYFITGDGKVIESHSVIVAPLKDHSTGELVIGVPQEITGKVTLIGTIDLKNTIQDGKVYSYVGVEPFFDLKSDRDRGQQKVPMYFIMKDVSLETTDITIELKYLMALNVLHIQNETSWKTSGVLKVIPADTNAELWYYEHTETGSPYVDLLSGEVKYLDKVTPPEGSYLANSVYAQWIYPNGKSVPEVKITCTKTSKTTINSRPSRAPLVPGKAYHYYMWSGDNFEAPDRFKFIDPF